MKFRGSRIIALLLSIMMVVPTFAFADVAPQKTTIKYKDFFKNSAQQMECCYDDSFWAGKSTKYDNQLASLSMAMVLTAGNSTDTNAVEALTGIGCEKVVSKGYENRTEKAAASVMGVKTLADGTRVIAVIIRGSRNSAEWAKNVELGKSGDAAGYSAAAKTIYNNAVSYIKKNAGKNYKIWIAGHSRGGALANLAGKKLSDKYGKAKVYGYCFENPVVAAKNKKDAKYTNIHNFRDIDSGVTTAMPSYMNAFDLVGKWNKSVTAYGGNDAVVKEMLAKITTNADKYQSANDFKWVYLDINLGKVSAITSGDFDFEDLCGVYKEAPQKDFWKVVQKRLKLLASSRKAYTVTKSAKAQAAAKALGYKASDAYTPEKAMQTLMKVVLDPKAFEGVEFSEETLMGGLTALLADAKFSDNDLLTMAMELMNNEFPAKLKSYLIGNQKKYANAVAKLWAATGLEKQIASKTEKKQLKLMMATLLEPLVKMLVADFNEDHADEVFLSLAYNADRLVQAHYPEVTMAWLMSQDNLYN